MMSILRRYATWKNTIILLIAQFAAQFSILFLIYPQIGGQGYPLDIRKGMTPSEVRSYVEGLSEKGRDIYAINEGTADVLYPVLYSAAFAFLLFRLLAPVTGEGSRWRRLALLPFCLAVTDLFENASIIGTLATRAENGPWLDGVVLFNAVKGVLISVTLAVLGVTLCVRLFFFLKRKFSGAKESER
jgi:hypothetical protein